MVPNFMMNFSTHTRVAQKIFLVISLFLLQILFLDLGHGWKSVKPDEVPLTFHVDKQVWHTSTYVTIPMTITILTGWKLNGPPGYRDTLVRPPQFSCKDPQVESVVVQWPAAELWTEKGQQAHVYKKHVAVEVEVRLKKHGKQDITLSFSGLCCSTLCRPLSQDITVTLSPPSDVLHVRKPSLWYMLWYGFLGGIILNVMPCVFPVLGLKLSGLANAPAHLLRQVCIFTILGIFASFFGLALLIICLQKIFLYEVGWGMQFQNPYFASVMSMVMVLFGHSFLGGGTLSTPQWLYRLVPQHSGEALYAFFSGVLAVFLATPCSAPFLGAAVGFALTGSSMAILGIFLSIALGFSLPYWVSFVLPVGKILPKPGPWMKYASSVTGVFFWITAVWLVAMVLMPFLSPPLQYVAWGLLASIIVFPVLGRLAKRWNYINSVSFFFVLSTCCGIFFIGLPFAEKMSVSSHNSVYTVPMDTGKIHFHPWSEEKMAEVLATGAIIFLDVTAAACLNCEVNKRRVLLRKDIQTLLRSKDIVCLRADFTMGSPDILKMLKRFGRAGIPFNLLVSKEYPDGLVLSEFLSEKEVMDGIAFLREKALQKKQ